MEKIMATLARETKGKSYNTLKYSFDSIGLPSIDYENESDKVMKWKDVAETAPKKQSTDMKPMAEKIATTIPLISYFLDGSRHAYKVDDIGYGNQVFPVVAGQIGVGCCKRTNGKMSSEKFNYGVIIALPDKSNADGWDDTPYFKARTQKLNNHEFLRNLGISISAIKPYSTSSTIERSKLEDRGIAVIQDSMIESEKRMVQELVAQGKLNQENFLLKDGSLEYKEMGSGDKDLRSLLKIKNNYNWVIGVSKSFNPESCMDHKGKPNASYIVDLPLYHRTPVAKFESIFLKDIQFAIWYVRLRRKEITATPFDGVVKVEKILITKKELESGIDTELVDLISANIVNERNPTCYGADLRWANHLYPVYLTECYIKSKYISTKMFLSLF